MQGQKAAMQTRIWNEAEFLPGATVIRPNNVTDSGDPVPVNQPDREPVALPEPEPDRDPESEREPGDFDPDSVADEPDDEPGSRGGVFVVAGVMLAGVLGGLLL